MSKRNTIYTNADARAEKMARESRVAYASLEKARKASEKAAHEAAQMTRFPQIGMVQTAKGRVFYAFVNGYDADPVRNADIDVVAAAVEEFVAGPFPIGSACPGQTVTYIG